MDDKIKRLVNELLQNHGDGSTWDKWARRLVMGIDPTKEAAEKALSLNESKFKVKTGADRSTMDCYYDMIGEHNAYYCAYIARSCVCRAAIANAKAGILKGKDALDLALEAKNELNQARNSLDCIP